MTTAERREAILAQIRAYHRKRGTTVILVSHSMEEIARNVDRIVVLSDSHVLMEGAPRQVFARAHELEQVGLDIPQVTKVALALRQRGLPVDTAVMKPQIAPMIIMPSTPRFSTPDFSTTSSPKAASKAGWSAKLMWRALNSAGLNKSLKFMVFPLVLLNVALLLDWVVEAV